MSLNNTPSLRYAAKHDRGIFYRGDTLPGFTLTLLEGDGTEGIIIPFKHVCCQIKNIMGKVVYTYLYVFPEPEDQYGTVVFEDVPSSITKTMSAGKYKYDVQITDNNDVVRTYLYGSFEIREDISKCQ